MIIFHAMFKPSTILQPITNSRPLNHWFRTRVYL